MDKIPKKNKMINQRIKSLRDKFEKYNIDGYIIPKNDEFFSEYAAINRLETISKFTGSAGIAIILKKKNYLFVDGRYTQQAYKQSGKEFKIIEIHKNLPKKIMKNLRLGIDPSLFTEKILKIYFGGKLKIIKLKKNLIDEIYFPKKNKINNVFSLPNKAVGETHISKIRKIKNIIKKNRCDYLFISSPENVAWLLNIRGRDNPFSPMPNCRIIVNSKGKIIFFSDIKKSSKIK